VKRREFMSLLGGAAAWPIAARAQQPGKLPIIGFLGGASALVESQWAAAFVQRLHQLGWTEGRTVAIEYRWAEGRNEPAEIVAEFVRLKVDIIVTYGTPSILAAKQATSAIPIVFAAAGDPVRTGIVASLARPGGNVTGLSLLATDLAGKRIELLREVVPSLRRLALLGNVGNPQVVVEIGEVQAAARTLGLDVITSSEIRKAEDVAPAFESFKGRADALFVVLDPLINNNRLPIASLALGARLPTMHGLRDLVEAGGLISYAANFPDLFRRTAGLVDKILRGVKPAEIPVEQPTKFDLVVNLNTAKALGLTIPETFLARADEVIE
jgi:putative tryptophan/tyrosine transport system substrate-binding protein